MKTWSPSPAAETPGEALDTEGISLFIDEGERVLRDLDRRLVHGGVLPDPVLPGAYVDGPTVELDPQSSLRRAVADLVVAYPSIGDDLHDLADRTHAAGTRSAARILETKPQLIQLVRLALELFFEEHPTLACFEGAEFEDDEVDDPEGEYQAHADLRDRLRTWTS